jgi:CRISPR-associated protein Csx10
MVLDERMLAEACGTEWVDAQTSPAEWPQGALPLKLVRSYASYTYRAGWNAPWGFPKDVAVTTLAGSVFVFRTPATYARDWVQKLAGVELQGVGLRLAEGFGRVCICDEFHLIRRENPV